MTNMKKIIPLATSALLYAHTPSALASNNDMPNIIYILADDLGIGDLSCYGQRWFKTPAIDKLAHNGIKFTQHYSGSTVSAPSRASLLTGMHTGNSYIRGNKGVRGSDGKPYDYPLADSIETVAEVLKRANYTTACIGKWGLGGPHTEGHPNRQGFDYFFGYLGQANAHRYYPEFLYENQEKIFLNKTTYSHDLIINKALSYIETHADKPFFLYLTPTIPHADLTIPEDETNPYANAFMETPYATGGYTPQDKPKATFAAMVSRLDRDVSQIVQLLSEKNLLENTLIIFTSDNGTHIEGGHDPYFFNSNGGFRGTKRDLYEGGIRTPFIAHWPKQIKPGQVSYHLSAFWDFLPTICELVHQPQPSSADGISYLPTLTGKGEQKKHQYLYWEFHEQGGKQAIRLPDGWKLIKYQVNNTEKTHYELFNLHADPTERSNVAQQFPEKVARLHQMINKIHTPSTLFPFRHEQPSTPK